MSDTIRMTCVIAVATCLMGTALLQAQTLQGPPAGYFEIAPGHFAQQRPLYGDGSHYLSIRRQPVQPGVITPAFPGLHQPSGRRANLAASVDVRRDALERSVDRNKRELSTLAEQQRAELRSLLSGGTTYVSRVGTTPVYAVTPPTESSTPGTVEPTRRERLANEVQERRDRPTPRSPSVDDRRQRLQQDIAARKASLGVVSRRPAKGKILGPPPPFIVTSTATYRRLAAR